MADHRIRVHYPLGGRRLLLRCDADWDRDLTPHVTTEHGSEFVVDSRAPYFYFKPVLVDGGGAPRVQGPQWAQGENYLAVTGAGASDVYPFFAADDTCSACTRHELASRFAPPGYTLRVATPKGYRENTLARYPVLIMQDGHNALLPDDAFLGRHWQVSDTLRDLDAMSLVRGAIVVGVYPRERTRDYTSPGYAGYGRFLAYELKPWLDAHYRTRTGPRHTAVMGSSLGGVASLHCGLAHSDVFGSAACLSSTFGYQDDLHARVTAAGKVPVQVYLDSGWPRDNYEATRAMHDALRRAGWQDGRDLHYFAFPRAAHDEAHWASRVHLPLQVLFGHGESHDARALSA
jgi:predicted alpha/beta superfamily hydrolase